VIGVLLPVQILFALGVFVIVIVQLWPVTVAFALALADVLLGSLNAPVAVPMFVIVPLMYWSAVKVTESPFAIEKLAGTGGTTVNLLSLRLPVQVKKSLWLVIL
jgi:hypothetical protein